MNNNLFLLCFFYNHYPDCHKDPCRARPCANRSRMGYNLANGIRTFTFLISAQ